MKPRGEMDSQHTFPKVYGTTLETEARAGGFLMLHQGK
jgi:hypothetical protein